MCVNIYTWLSLCVASSAAIFHSGPRWKRALAWLIFLFAGRGVFFFSSPDGIPAWRATYWGKDQVPAFPLSPLLQVMLTCVCRSKSFILRCVIGVCSDVKGISYHLFFLFFSLFLIVIHVVSKETLTGGKSISHILMSFKLGTKLLLNDEIYIT